MLLIGRVEILELASSSFRKPEHHDENEKGRCNCHDCHCLADAADAVSKPAHDEQSEAAAGNGDNLKAPIGSTALTRGEEFWSVHGKSRNGDCPDHGGCDGGEPKRPPP